MEVQVRMTGDEGGETLVKQKQWMNKIQDTVESVILNIQEFFPRSWY